MEIKVPGRYFEREGGEVFERSPEILGNCWELWLVRWLSSGRDSYLSDGARESPLPSPPGLSRRLLSSFYRVYRSTYRIIICCLCLLACLPMPWLGSFVRSFACLLGLVEETRILQALRWVGWVACALLARTFPPTCARLFPFFYFLCTLLQRSTGLTIRNSIDVLD